MKAFTEKRGIVLHLAILSVLVLAFASSPAMAAYEAEVEWGWADTDGDGRMEQIFHVTTATYYAVKIKDDNGPGSSERFINFFDLRPYPYAQDKLEIVGAANLDADRGNELIILGRQQLSPTSTAEAEVYVIKDHKYFPDRARLYHHDIEPRGETGFYNNSGDYGFELDGTGGDEVVYLHAAKKGLGVHVKVVVIDFTHETAWVNPFDTTSLQVTAIEDLDGRGGKEIVTFHGADMKIHVGIIDYTTEYSELFDFSAATGKYIDCKDTNTQSGKEVVIIFPEKAPTTVGVVDWRNTVKRVYDSSPDFIGHAGFGKIDETAGEEIVIKRMRNSQFFNYVDVIHDAEATKPVAAYGEYPKISGIKIFNTDADSQKEIRVTYNDGNSSVIIDETPVDEPPTACFSANGKSAATISICRGGKVRFDAQCASDPEGDSLQYKWNFGDGSSTGWQTSQQATRRYTTVGTYRAKLIVKDPGGNENSVSKTIKVEGSCIRRPGGRKVPIQTNPKTQSK